MPVTLGSRFEHNRLSYMLLLLLLLLQSCSTDISQGLEAYKVHVA